MDSVWLSQLWSSESDLGAKWQSEKKQLYVNSNMQVNIDTLDKIFILDYKDITIIS